MKLFARCVPRLFTLVFYAKEMRQNVQESMACQSLSRTYRPAEPNHPLFHAFGRIRMIGKPEGGMALGGLTQDRGRNSVGDLL